MRLYEFASKPLLEGGNVFKNAQGEVVTTRIARSDIAPTLKWLESITGLPLVNNTLGSVGKKDSSGDLDIAVDQNTVSKDDLVNKLSSWITSQGENPKEWVKKSGISVHFKTPIKGDSANGFVQTDFMFGDDLEQMKFGLFAAGDTSRFSGADRNLIMSSLAKSLPGDFKYSWQKGLIKRSTSEPISKNPDEIASVLLGKSASRNDLDSIETIVAALKKNPSRIKDLENLIVNLRSSEGKKPSAAKSDADEADRITTALAAIG